MRPLHSKYLLLFVLPCLCGIMLASCGGGKEAPDPAAFTIVDNAGILARSDRDNLSKLAQSLHTVSGASVVVITDHVLLSQEPSGFADLTFADGPRFKRFTKQTESDSHTEGGLREKWLKRGVLIYATQYPQLVFVRCGSDFRELIEDTGLHRAMEVQVYDRLMLGKLAQATVGALQVVETHARQEPSSVKELGWWSSHVYSTLQGLKELRFPSFRPYYYLAVDPLANSMVLVMKATAYTLWGVVLWLLLIHLSLRFVWSKIFGAILYRIGCRQIRRKNPSFSETQVREAVDQHFAKPGIKLGNRKFSDALMHLFTIGLGLPVWACLSLITLPFWENVLTLRNHLLPAIQAGLDSHRVFAFQHGFLWWSSPAGPAGVGFAIVFAIFYWVARLPDLPGKLKSLAKSAERGEEITVDRVVGILLSPVLVPAAVGFLPFSLGLYFLIGTMVDAWGAVGKHRLSAAARREAEQAELEKKDAEAETSAKEIKLRESLKTSEELLARALHDHGPIGPGRKGLQMMIAADVVNTCLELSGIYLKRGTKHDTDIGGWLDRAEKLLQRALEIDEKIERTPGMAYEHLGLGDIRKAKKDMQGARTHWTKAREMYERIDEPYAADMLKHIRGLLGRNGK